MKKFFRKIRMDAKFARAGEGHKLTEDTRNYRMVTQPQPHIRTRPMTSSQAQAGAAAIARHEQKSKQTKTVVPKVIKSRPDSQESDRSMPYVGTTEDTKEKRVIPAVEKGVMFHSPFTDEIVSKADLKDHMRENLILLLNENAVEASSLMIETLNRNSEKKETAVTTLNKYLDNVISHPEEEKYAKIRKNNRIFVERISPVEGCEEFLEAVGFKRTLGEKDEIFFVLESVDVEKLKEAKEILASAKGMDFRIFRDAKILIPNPGQSMKFDLPEDFFKRTSSEVKQEQDRRTNEIELNKQMRTKVMREASNVSYSSKYAMIRVRFPDERLLQGTFRANETVEDLKSFVREYINVEWAVFYLKTPLGECIEEDSTTLLSLKLVPTAVLNLSWNEEIRMEILKEQNIRLALRDP